MFAMTVNSIDRDTTAQDTLDREVIEAWLNSGTWVQGEGWAHNELSNADLGDPRRTWRAIDLAQKLAERPMASLPEAAGDWSTTKAAYRFFDNDGVEPDALCASHVGATLERASHFPVVLAPQDTSLLDFTSHPATTGMGPLSASYQKGLLMHTTLAMTPSRVPLGILQQQVWARDPDTFAKQEDHKKRPIAEKESNKWLESLEAVIEARKQCPNTLFVSIGDREADVYDLFLKERPEGVEILVRASWNRGVEHEEKQLWAAMATAPIAAEVTLNIPRQENTPARTATLNIRWKAITVRAPQARRNEKLPNIEIGVVWAMEVDTPENPRPEGVKPVEWMLLTTIPITNTQEALEKLYWYACRWGIEVWHKVLKSGCRIEERQLQTAERLQRCLTLYSIVAWRIMFATMLCRIVPDIPCSILLEEEEWQALYCAIHRTSIAPDKPPKLSQAVRWIGQLGGFLGRKRDGEPGVKAMWKGFEHLADLTSMYSIMRPRSTRRLVGNA